MNILNLRISHRTETTWPANHKARNAIVVGVREVLEGGLCVLRAVALAAGKLAGTRSTRALFALLALLSFASPTRAADPDRSTFNIQFDDTAVRQLLTMIKTKDTSDTSIDSWLNLPANQYILRTGANEQDLTREQFRSNLIAVINGTATRESQPLESIGCLLVSSVDDLTAMLDALDTSEGARVVRMTARLRAFSPTGVHIKETVYVHLGGDWDAINDHGPIYVNLRFWHDLHKPSWEGLDMIVAHETMHSVQNAAYGNPEVASDQTGAWMSALSKIQREGTARYVENDTDPGPYQPDTYGFYERAITAESYRAFANDVKQLQPLYASCFPTFDHDKFADCVSNGISSGGPYYDIGYGIARAIDERLGRKVLIETVVRGPKDFFSQYMALAAGDRDLPRLPVDFVKAVDAMPEKLDAAKLEGDQKPQAFAPSPSEGQVLPSKGGRLVSTQQAPR